MRRPTAATVFGVLNIVFGALGLCATPFSLTGAFSRSGPLAALADDSLWRTYSLVSGIVSLAVSVVLIVAGIGLLKTLRWARLVSIYYAVFSLVWGGMGLAFTVVYVLPKITAQVSWPAAVGGVVGGVAGGVLALAYPVLLLIFMTRPAMVRAYEGNRVVMPAQDAR